MINNIQQFFKDSTFFKSSHVRDFLFKYGNNFIINMIIVRSPIHSILKIIIDKVSNKYYDKLYHSYMFFQLDNNKYFFIEKKEVVRIEEVYTLNFINDQIEYIVIDVKNLNVTMNTLLYNAENAIGKDKLWIFSSVNSNCQDFLYSLLFFSNIGDSNVYNFIKQDIDNIVSNRISNFVDSIINIASRLYILNYGSTLFFFVVILIILFGIFLFI